MMKKVIIIAYGRVIMMRLNCHNKVTKTRVDSMTNTPQLKFTNKYFVKKLPIQNLLIILL